MENVERYRAALEQAGARFEFVVYPGPGHGFLTFDPEASHVAAANDAWERAVAFLRTTLTPSRAQRVPTGVRERGAA
jgi:dienelactone hydrolase